jgi:parallel beta-helix repeat protein
MNEGSGSVGVYLGIGAVRNAMVSNNTITDCTFGIRAATTYSQAITGLSVVGNSVSGSLSEGMYLLYTTGSQVHNNSILNGGGDGVMLYHCQDIVLKDNMMDANQQYGLEIRDTDGCQVHGNIFQGNALEGIYLASGSGNVIHTNALLFNKGSGRQYSPLRIQAYCGEGENNWSLGTGNLWADWLSPDQDEDGLVDLPYLIPNGFQDPFPLTDIPGLEIPADLTPPEVSQYAPQGTSADQGSAISVIFSEDMDQGSVTAMVNSVTRTGVWEDRTYTLSMTLDYETDYQVLVSGQDLAGNNMTAFEWTFRTEGPEATVCGRAVTEDATVMAGVKVVCGNQTVYTDQGGNFSLLLPPGSRTLVLSKDGYLDKNLTVQVLPGHDLDLGDVAMEACEEERTSHLPYLALAAIVVVSALALLGVWWWRRRK